MSGNKHKHIILYAEDDADDVFMVRQAFQRYDGAVELLHATDGFEAIESLKRTELRGLLPCLIILDINMPGMDGRETLIRIKQTPSLRNIPVILFTTSSSTHDKNFAQAWGAKFCTKPLLYAELEQMAHDFLNLCTSVVSERA